MAREVMVPRTDIVFIERTKTLRQALSLALRSGFSRVPVIDQNLDDVLGIAYLKDLTKRVFDNRDAETTERVESIVQIGRASCRDSEWSTIIASIAVGYGKEYFDFSLV